MIPLFKVKMSKKASKAVEKVLNSGYIGQGEKVEEFEKALESTLNNVFSVSVNSATSAEHLALHLLKKPAVSSKIFDGIGQTQEHWPGIKPGEEVLATPLTCTASNWPILANGFKIKWVDVDPKNLNMDLEDLARKISPTTKAIMLVHWGGYPVDLDRIKAIQKQAYTMYGFKPAIIEDSAHAFGSKFNKQPIGSHGNINTFSFQAIKHLTCGDGGALLLPHQELYNRAKLLRWYGIDRETNSKDFRCEADIPEWGFKFHMNDINATIGLSNLPEMKEVLDKHRSNAQYYDEHLKGLDKVTLLERDPRMDSSFWTYSLLVDDKNAFMEHMKKHSIMVSQVHERNDFHTCVYDYRAMLPNLDAVIPRLISIPVGWWVTEKEREFIVECIKEGW